MNIQAFPNEIVYIDEPKRSAYSEMTLKDYFAGQALMGILNTCDNISDDKIAEWSYQLAEVDTEHRVVIHKAFDKREILEQISEDFK